MWITSPTRSVVPGSSCICGRLGFGACRSPGRRLLRCFLSDRPSFSNRLSAPCCLGDGRFLAFRLGSGFCRHGSLPDAHCIWKACVRSLLNKKVSQLARRPGTKTLQSIAPSSTWAASYLCPSSAAFITTIAESSFQYTHRFLIGRSQVRILLLHERRELVEIL